MSADNGETYEDDGSTTTEPDVVGPPSADDGPSEALTPDEGIELEEATHPGGAELPTGDDDEPDEAAG